MENVHPPSLREEANPTIHGPLEGNMYVYREGRLVYDYRGIAPVMFICIFAWRQVSNSTAPSSS